MQGCHISLLFPLPLTPVLWYPWFQGFQGAKGGEKTQYRIARIVQAHFNNFWRKFPQKITDQLPGSCANRSRNTPRSLSLTFVRPRRFRVTSHYLWGWEYLSDSLRFAHYLDALTAERIGQMERREHWSALPLSWLYVYRSTQLAFSLSPTAPSLLTTWVVFSHFRHLRKLWTMPFCCSIFFLISTF